MPTNPHAIARARRAAAGLAILALLWGATLGWFAGAGGHPLEYVLLVAALSLVIGWPYWRSVRAAIRKVAAEPMPTAEDVAALEAGVAAHEARVRPEPRVPGVVTISDGKGVER